MSIYDPKTYGYKRSNYKNYFETDPESFKEKKKKMKTLRKRWVLRQDPVVIVLFVVNYLRCPL